MKNQTVSVFQKHFEQEWMLNNNSVCDSCDAQIKHPLLPWLVGSKYWSTNERILFVGKPHRGTPGEILPSGIIDPTEMLKELITYSWPYWSYTKEIITNIYGDVDSGWDSIAFTNIIKCTNVGAEDASNSNDKTSYKMAECCIKKLGVIFKEIKILEPRNIVFYTHSLFREFLSKIEDGSQCVEITSELNKKPCRNKELYWWDRTYHTSWYDNVRVLVIGHPERMAKKEYVNLVVHWLTSRITEDR